MCLRKEGVGRRVTGVIEGVHWPKGERLWSFFFVQVLDLKLMSAIAVH